MIMRMLKLPDGRVKILVQGLSKARITEYVSDSPFYTVRTERQYDLVVQDTTLETEALIRTVREQLAKIIELGKQVSPEVMVILENISDPGSMADLIASNLGLKVADAQTLLEINDPIVRLTYPHSGIPVGMPIIWTRSASAAFANCLYSLTATIYSNCCKFIT